MKTQLVSPNFLEFWFDLVISMFKFVEMFWFFIYLHVLQTIFKKETGIFFCKHIFSLGKYLILAYVVRKYLGLLSCCKIKLV